MGDEIAMAVYGIPVETILERAGLKKTGQFCDRKDSCPGMLIGFRNRKGWYLIVPYFDNHKRLFDPFVLSRLSTGEGTEVLTIWFVEGTMTSEIEWWRNGSKLTRIFHDCSSKGSDHLEIEGESPPLLGEIRKKQENDSSLSPFLTSLFDELQTKLGRDSPLFQRGDNFQIPIDLYISVTGHEPGGDKEPEFESALLEYFDLNPE